MINLGVYGYDTAYEVERYRKRGQKYHPDLVIWYHLDLLRLNEEFMGLFKFGLKAVDKRVDLSEKEKSVLGRSLFVSLSDSIRDKFNKDSILKYQIKAVELFNKYYNSPLLFVINPSLPQSQRNILKTFTNNSGHYYLDGLRDFSKESGIVINDGHPNQKGHRMISEDIFNYLQVNKLIPCN